MAGLMCAKEVIDSLARLGGLAQCAIGAISLYLPVGLSPTKKELRIIEKGVSDLEAGMAAMLDRMKESSGPGRRNG